MKIIIGAMIALFLCQFIFSDDKNTKSPKIDCVLTIQVEKINNNQVRLHGKTNLPSGTHLLLDVRANTINGFSGQTKTQVTDNGTWQSEVFGTKAGLPNGNYVAIALMPISFSQPDAVRAIIGKSGENLSGAFVKKGSAGIIVENKTTFTIGQKTNDS